MMPHVSCRFFSAFLLTASLSLQAQSPAPRGDAPARKINSMDAAHAHEIFHDVYNDVRRDYYDPTFHGVDLEHRYHDFDARIDTAGSMNEAFIVIAGFLNSFHDSHLFFGPPMRSGTYQVDYRMQMIGTHCYVTQVRPDTDAATKLHVGDEVLQLNGYGVDRSDIWNVEYIFHTLNPAPREQFVLLSPERQKRVVIVTHQRKAGKKVMDLTTGEDFWDLVRQDQNDEDMVRERSMEHGDVMVWKMAEFTADINTVESIYGKARKHQTLIIDLRGNPGGSIDSLEMIAGYLFDHDVKISDRIGRKTLKPQIAKSFRNPYKGKLIVLVDSGSASSSELLARIVQLQHRGTVLGDTSAGAVMEAHQFGDSIGADTVIAYGMSITDANLIMADGKSLEHVGVTPDEVILPTAADLVAGRDPVMARAFQLAGSSAPAEAPGRIFPYMWPRQ